MKSGEISWSRWALIERGVRRRIVSHGGGVESAMMKLEGTIVS
jgi:hypothetical protein